MFTLNKTSEKKIGIYLRKKTLQNEKGLNDYIDYVLTRLTTVGAIYIALVALLPEFLLSKTSIPFYLGGASLLIVVVVMIDFITQIQSHLFQHQYEGLLKKTKLKGRIKISGA